jgi:hypothetical protein
MLHFYLKEHSKNCACNTPVADRNYNNRDLYFYEQLIMNEKYFCEKTPCNLIIFHDSDFYLITYHYCAYRNQYDLILEFIKQGFKSKNKPYSVIDKSIPFDKKFKTMREDLFSMGSFIHEVNFIYQDAAGKQYCIYTEIPLIEKILNHDIIFNNYQLAKKELHGSNKEHLIEDVKELFYVNQHPEIKENQIISTTNQLIKQLNKRTNESRS